MNKIVQTQVERNNGFKRITFLDAIKLALKIRRSEGCILITKGPGYAIAEGFGNVTLEDLDLYTKGFNDTY